MTYNPLNGSELRFILCQELKQYCAQHPAFKKDIHHEGAQGTVTMDVHSEPPECGAGKIEVSFNLPGPTTGDDLLATAVALAADHMRGQIPYQYSLCHHNVTARLILRVTTEKTYGETAGGVTKSVALQGKKELRLQFECDYTYPDKAREKFGLAVPTPQFSADGRNMAEFAENVDPFEALNKL